MDRALFHSRHLVHLLVGICPGVRHSRLSGHCPKIGRSIRLVAKILLPEDWPFVLLIWGGTVVWIAINVMVTLMN
jgi:hypothetical protein